MSEFRLGLIGSAGHWREYVPVLDDLPGAQIAAVAPAEPGQDIAAFDRAPGVTARTARWSDHRALLAADGLDAVQVCVRPHRTAAVVAECLRAGIPVMADKPLAVSDEALVQLWGVYRETGTFLAPMHMYRRMANFALAADMVRQGRVGEVVGGHCQISFRWGDSRPDWFRSRDTFPGAFTFIGVHAVDTLFWVAGDCFERVNGRQSTTPHPDYPACASLAYATVELANGGVFVLSTDFQRPMGAATHGDVRLRIAGTAGTLDASEGTADCLSVVDASVDDVIRAPAIPYWYTTFARHVLGAGEPFIRPSEAFRVAELTLRIQRALDTERPVELRATQIAQ